MQLLFVTGAISANYELMSPESGSIGCPLNMRYRQAPRSFLIWKTLILKKERVSPQ